MEKAIPVRRQTHNLAHSNRHQSGNFSSETPQSLNDNGLIQEAEVEITEREVDTGI